MSARLDRARPMLRIDVNVGDPVTPAPVEVLYPALLSKPFAVIAYPIETVLAEKIVTMIDRGDTTTRERDFADVALLISEHEVDAASLRAAIEATAAHRQSTLRPLAEVLVALPTMRQADWPRFVSQHGLAAYLPATYQELIEVVARFADPILIGAVSKGRWLPSAGTWGSVRVGCQLA